MRSAKCTHAQRIQSMAARKRPQLVNTQAKAKAMDDTLRLWPALTIHTTDVRIPIDNNAVENAIHPLSLGRKPGCLWAASKQTRAPPTS
ncbi:MAG: transposase [Hydrogenophaga sp.]